MCFLSLHTICTVMGGGGGVGDRRDVTHILATFRKGDRRVNFDKIVGIDWSKFKVTTLADTLRSPKK